jgi:hypothetical protein
MHDLAVLSVVALLHDLPEQRLVRGQVGTIVEELAPGVLEVEFSDEQGRTYAKRLTSQRRSDSASLRALSSRSGLMGPDLAPHPQILADHLLRLFQP